MTTTKSTTKKKPITMVTLAKDILKWLEKPSKAPINPRRKYGYFRMLEYEPTDVQAKLKAAKEPVCDVCAIGAFVAAKAFREDNLRVSYLNRDQAIRFLEPVFTKAQREDYLPLIEIEEAFEAGEGLKAQTAVGRLRAICRNVIANKGVFIPK